LYSLHSIKSPNFENHTTLLFITCPENNSVRVLLHQSTVPTISATTITRQNAKHKRVRRSRKTDLQILAISLNPPKPRKA
jgi:hypothetical protein